MGADSSPEAIRAMTIKLGLDQPLVVRYLHWIGGLLVGDLGTSYSYGTPVADLIAERRKARDFEGRVVNEREPMQVDAEEDDQQESREERRHGEADEREGRREVAARVAVDPA